MEPMESDKLDKLLGGLIVVFVIIASLIAGIVIYNAKTNSIHSSNVNNHIKIIQNSIGRDLQMLCINNIEYIEAPQYRGISITPSLNKEGKPRECNY